MNKGEPMKKNSYLVNKRAGFMRIFFIVILTASAFVSGCATTKGELNLYTPDKKSLSRVWPEAPEKPRFRYLGELTGEDNFTLDDGKGVTFGKFLSAIAGAISGGGYEPVTLQRPQSGIVDNEGRVYVTDVSRQAIYVFDNVAGELKIWDMAKPTISFSAPISIAFGNTGEILVSDGDLGLVSRLSMDGKPIGVIGEGKLQRPTGIARDPETGMLYVADTHAHDIKVFNNSGKLEKTIGSRGNKNGHFNFPTFLVFEKDKLYVSDSMNARVQIFDRDGKFIGKFGRRGLYLGEFTHPKGIAVDGDGNIYVVESYHDHLLVFDKDGQFLLPLGGSGAGVGMFYLPAGVWIDNRNRVYVADMFNRRVVVFQYLGSGAKR